MTASLSGSARRLAEVEGEVRHWVDRHLSDNAEADDASDSECAATLADLRALRPRLHPETRGYADSIVDLIGDLRDSINRGGTLTARRAEGLRRSLETLAMEVATLGLAEPQ